MGTMPSPKFYEIMPPRDRLTFRMAGAESGHRFSGEPPPYGGRRPRRASRLLVMFLLGAVVALTWQRYGFAARETIAGLSPTLRWLAPQPEETPPDRIDQITRSVDRIATNMAASQEQITRSIDHLAAGQEQMAREIIRLQAISQFGATKPPEPPPHPDPPSPPRKTRRSLR